jgi:hypothetical protein
MIEQLPPGVLGVAVVVLLYSILCLACGVFLLWLVWVHDERKSCKPLVSCSGLRWLTTQMWPCWASS